MRYHLPHVCLLLLYTEVEKTNHRKNALGMYFKTGATCWKVVIGSFKDIQCFERLIYSGAPVVVSKISGAIVGG
jgi:hypothetical protein